ncbi:C-type lectin-like domain-containing protein [Pseudoalteromonas xiamenensis]
MKLINASVALMSTAFSCITLASSPVKFNDNYYEFVEVTAPYVGNNNTWHTAELEASQRVFKGVNGRLAIVDSQAENDFLYGLISGQYTGFKGAWLGGKYPEGWITGNTSSFNYFGFGGSEPNNSGYVYMNIGESSWGIGSGQWADDSGVQGVPVDNVDPVIGYFVEYEGEFLPTPTKRAGLVNYVYQLDTLPTEFDFSIPESNECGSSIYRVRSSDVDITNRKFAIVMQAFEYGDFLEFTDIDECDHNRAIVSDVKVIKFTPQ